ncbi:MAG: hypothetical protein ACRCVW_00210 [Brevinema sp.]
MSQSEKELVYDGAILKETSKLREHITVIKRDYINWNCSPN